MFIFLLLGNPYDGKASDMWAIGVLLYTMLCGQFPFYDNDRQELFKKICMADFIIPRLALHTLKLHYNVTFTILI